MQAYDATETRDPRERPRHEARVRVRVRLRPGAQSCALPGRTARRLGRARNGQIVGNTNEAGEYELTVYQSDAERLAASKVEPDMAMVERAYDMFHRGLAAFVRERQMKDPMAEAPRPLPVNPSEWTPAERHLALRYGGSVEETFVTLMGRSMRPLESLEVIEHLDPPVTPEVQSTIQAAEAIRRAHEAVSGVTRETALLERLADLEAKIAELTKPGKKNTPQQ